MTVFKCPFSMCEQKSHWFSGFATEEELNEHLKLHRCQWISAQNDFKACTFIPTSEIELRKHIEEHLNLDDIPFQQHPNGGRHWYCPWQTCDSSSYSSKGTRNRTHIVDHIRKHIGQMKNRYKANRMRTNFQPKKPKLDLLFPPVAVGNIPFNQENHNPRLIRNLHYEEKPLESFIFGDFLKSPLKSTNR